MVNVRVYGVPICMPDRSDAVEATMMVYLVPGVRAVSVMLRFTFPWVRVYAASGSTRKAEYTESQSIGALKVSTIPTLEGDMPREPSGSDEWMTAGPPGACTPAARRRHARSAEQPVRVLIGTV